MTKPLIEQFHVAGKDKQQEADQQQMHEGSYRQSA